MDNHADLGLLQFDRSLMKGNVSGEAKLKQTLAKYNCELKALLIKAISYCESWITVILPQLKTP